VAWGWLDAARYQAEQERKLEESLAASLLVSPPAAPGGPFVPGRDTSGGAVLAPGEVLPPREGEQAGAGSSSAPRPPRTDERGGGERQASVTATGSQSSRTQSSAGLARLAVPRLGMTVMVGGDVATATLRRAAGHIPGTAPLGSAGNVGLAGHRDSFFRPLRRIAVGDEIVLTTPNAVSIYHVEWTEVVTPEAVEVLGPTPYAALTLVTCYPFGFLGTAPDRFVVRARLVESRAPRGGELEAGLQLPVASALRAVPAAGGG
jgi:sortase A